MVTYTKTKAKHPRTILKCYRMFLIGSEDSEMLAADLLQKCKKFHECMLANHTFYKTGMSLGIPEHISKTMRTMFEQWQAGTEITFGVPSWEKCPHIVAAYAFLLAGATEEEMRETCTEFEIEKVRLFSQTASSDKLYATISKESGLPISTVKRLQKMYRDSQNQAGSLNLCIETAWGVTSMVGENIFPDAARMLANRQAAAQALARQNTAILNAEAAKAEAMRHSEQRHYITTPTGANPVIMRSNTIGAVVPSISAMRNLTPNGFVQQAMKPSMQTPSGVNRPLLASRRII